MKPVQTITVRFNLDKPEDRAAWERLRAMDRTQYRSLNRAIIMSVNDHFDRQEHPDETPFFGSAERDDRFFQRVYEAVNGDVSADSLGGVLGLAQLLRGLSAPVSGDSARENAAAIDESLDDALDFMNGL